MTGDDSNRYRENLRGEVDSAKLYRALATAESDPRLASVCQPQIAAEARELDGLREEEDVLALIFEAKGMTQVGLLAAGITFGVGRLIGVSVSD